MSNRLLTFAFAAVPLLLGTLGAADPVGAADGSVRFLTAGPVRLGDGHTSHMRVFLPAIHRQVSIDFLGEGGAVLKTVVVEPSDRGPGRFFEVFFEATYSEARRELSITDGTSNTLLFSSQNGIIAILIGLRNAGGMGTMQTVDAEGKHIYILPFIEQDNLFRR
jgi:hypothetical protein